MSTKTLYCLQINTYNDVPFYEIVLYLDYFVSEEDATIYGIFCQETLYRTVAPLDKVVMPVDVNVLSENPQKAEIVNEKEPSFIYHWFTREEVTEKFKTFGRMFPSHRRLVDTRNLG